MIVILRMYLDEDKTFYRQANSVSQSDTFNQHTHLLRMKITQVHESDHIIMILSQLAALGVRST